MTFEVQETHHKHLGHQDRCRTAYTQKPLNITNRLNAEMVKCISTQEKLQYRIAPIFSWVQIFVKLLKMTRILIFALKISQSLHFCDYCYCTVPRSQLKSHMDIFNTTSIQFTHSLIPVYLHALRVCCVNRLCPTACSKVHHFTILYLYSEVNFLGSEVELQNS